TITLEIIFRSLFDYSLLITDELSGYILLLITYIGVAYTLKTGSQVRVNILYDRYEDKRSTWIDVVICSITIWFRLNLLISNWNYDIDSFNRNEMSNGLMRAPLFIPKGIIVIGLGMLILQSVVGLGKAVEKIILKEED